MRPCDSLSCPCIRVAFGPRIQHLGVCSNACLVQMLPFLVSNSVATSCLDWYPQSFFAGSSPLVPDLPCYLRLLLVVVGHRGWRGLALVVRSRSAAV